MSNVIIDVQSKTNPIKPYLLDSYYYNFIPSKINIFNKFIYIYIFNKNRYYL